MQAVESVVRALVEQDALEGVMTTAPADTVAALLLQTRRQLNNPAHVDCALAVLHSLLTSRPGFANAEAAAEWPQQLQSILAEEMRTQEQLLSVLGLTQSLLGTS